MERSERRRTALAAAVLLVLPWLIYAPALRGPFVFDDLTGVVQVAAHLDRGQVADLLRFWEGGLGGNRPLRYLSLALDWRLGGGSPLLFHLTNVLLHALCGLLLWSLLRRLRAGGPVALLAALLFLVHPLQTEAVAYVSGRKDLLCALFYLLALHAHLSASRHLGVRRLLASAAFFLSALLAYLAKEMALTLPAAALLVDRVELGARPTTGDAGGGAGATGPGGRARAGATGRAGAAAWLAPLRRRPWLYGLLAAAGAAGLVDKLLLRPGTAVPLARALDVARNLPLAVRTLAWQVRKALVPWPQAADVRGLFPQRLAGPGRELPPPTWAEFWNGGGPIATAVGLLLLAGLVVAVRRTPPPRRAAAAAGLGSFLLLLLPVLNLVRLNEPAAEHYLYLPLAGLVVALAAWLAPPAGPRTAGDRKGAGVGGRGRALALLPVIVVAVLAGLSLHRAAVWASPERLWRSVVAVNPAGARGWANLGALSLAAGDTAQARALLRTALSREPGEPGTAANLIALLRARGEAAEAVRVGAEALRIHPDDRLLLSLEGGALLDLGRYAEAREPLERLATLQEQPPPGRPPVPEWRRDLGVARLRTGDPAGAVAALRQAAVERPDDPASWTNLGAALIEAGRPAEAEAPLRRALALPGASGYAHRNLAVALLRTGRPAAAAAELEAARAAGAPVPASLAEAVRRALEQGRP